MEMNHEPLIGGIDLLGLKGAVYTTLKGKKCIIIPTETNPCINVWEGGQRLKAFLGIAVVKSPDNKYGNSHFVKTSVSRKAREALGISAENLKDYTPILGNLKAFSKGRPAAYQQPTPAMPEDDDLPW